MANRIDIEIELSHGRAEALEWISSFSEIDLYGPGRAASTTPSPGGPS